MGHGRVSFGRVSLRAVARYSNGTFIFIHVEHYLSEGLSEGTVLDSRGLCGRSLRKNSK